MVIDKERRINKKFRMKENRKYPYKHKRSVVTHKEEQTKDL